MSIRNKSCIECGFPNMDLLLKNNIVKRMNGIFAIFPCQHCNKDINTLLGNIDKKFGVDVVCPHCNRTTRISSSVWCKKCGNSLVLTWHNYLSKR